MNGWVYYDKLMNYEEIHCLVGAYQNQALLCACKLSIYSSCDKAR